MSARFVRRISTRASVLIVWIGMILRSLTGDKIGKCKCSQIRIDAIRKLDLIDGDVIIVDLEPEVALSEDAEKQIKSHIKDTIAHLGLKDIKVLVTENVGISIIRPSHLFAHRKGRELSSVRMLADLKEQDLGVLRFMKGTEDGYLHTYPARDDNNDRVYDSCLRLEKAGLIIEYNRSEYELPGHYGIMTSICFKVIDADTNIEDWISEQMADPVKRKALSDHIERNR